jgi:hypothetical protein
VGVRAAKNISNNGKSVLDERVEEKRKKKKLKGDLM